MLYGKDVTFLLIDMISLLSLFCTLGFMFCYSSSKKAEESQFKNTLQKLPIVAPYFKYFGLGLILISTGGFMYLYGVGTGILWFTILIMTVFSLGILLVPLKLFSLKGFMAITLLLFTLEMLF